MINFEDVFTWWPQVHDSHYIDASAGSIKCMDVAKLVYIAENKTENKWEQMHQSSWLILHYESIWFSICAVFQ